MNLTGLSTLFKFVWKDGNAIIFQRINNLQTKQEIVRWIVSALLGLRLKCGVCMVAVVYLIVRAN